MLVEPQAVEPVVEEQPVEEKKPEPDPEEVTREDTVVKIFHFKPSFRIDINNLRL